MRGFQITRGNEPLRVMCFGAHSDDIEIGLGGTILGLRDANVAMRITWCVCSANGFRADEAEASAAAFLEGVSEYEILFGNFEDGYFPTHSKAIKQWMMDIRSHATPDLIFTHSRDDAHQDHREVNQLTWNVFRDQLILEYEIPKWDGDLSRPNVYFPVSRSTLERKIELLSVHFGTQRSKEWFDHEVFRGLARMRGMECRAPEHYAEAFHLRKGILAFV